jgi:UDP-glucuronate 4-epimerase
MVATWRPARTAVPKSGWSARGAELRTLVTGVAGFIGFHTARALAARGDLVIGIDNLNHYYDVALKKARLQALAESAPSFIFRKADLADREALHQALAGEKIDIVVHLAAQAGVRASITQPHIYAPANLVAHLNVLEYFRHHDPLVHLIYASSSSVYGANRKLPFAETDRVDDPVSLYAATKRADELMSGVYARLYGMPLTGIRFFTVYGPWGRPDMAVWLFTEAISEGRPITLYNQGRMRRDFTFIDDAVSGIAAIASGPPVNPERKLYNIGNNRSEELLRLVSIIEKSLGREAEIRLAPIQPGDVEETHADLSWIKADYGFSPTTTIEEGIPRFVDWYRAQFDRA